jgi:hypothetical protein
VQPDVVERVALGLLRAVLIEVPLQLQALARDADDRHFARGEVVATSGDPDHQRDAPHAGGISKPPGCYQHDLLDV